MAIKLNSAIYEEISKSDTFVNQFRGGKNNPEEGLDAKTKQLVYIAMKVVTDDKNAVKYHVPMAKSAGATREEIKFDVSLPVNSVLGGTI
ncbi:MAG: carboxymuconolactone decarboxylase family protein [Bacteroidales bacterium]|nr:carboxymuconolactone decarboxylase family protein [Bacteroidales bacterium]